MINKVCLIFKVDFDEGDEFVIEQIRDYLPKEAVFRDSDNNGMTYTLNEKVTYKINYFKKKESLKVIIKECRG